MEHCLRIIRLQLSAGRDGFFDIDLTGFQKLGCFGAGRSSLAEVVPVYLFSHFRILNIKKAETIILQRCWKHCWTIKPRQRNDHAGG